MYTCASKTKCPVFAGVHIIKGHHIDLLMDMGADVFADGNLPTTCTPFGTNESCMVTFYKLTKYLLNLTLKHTIIQF